MNSGSSLPLGPSNKRKQQKHQSECETPNTNVTSPAKSDSNSQLQLIPIGPGGAPTSKSQIIVIDHIAGPTMAANELL